MSADTGCSRMHTRGGYNSLAVLALAFCFASVLAVCPALGNASGPVSKVTGGFREGTCVLCHTSNSLNDGRVLGGIFQIDGAPRAYEAGKAYPVTITIGQPGQSRWGFELSARFADSGRQAGQWVVMDTRTQLRTDTEIQYVVHTSEGSRKGEKDGPVEFHVKWVAPNQAGGLILFNAAGNAADGSNTPVGDYIYTAGSFSKPAPSAPAEPEPVEVDAVPVKPAPRLQETSRLISLPTPVDLKRGSVEILIQHRFYESPADAGASEAFGIDSGANINLGLNVGLTDRLSAGISRSRGDKIVELRGIYELRTAKDSAWRMSLHAGVEGQQNFHQQYSPFFQLATSLNRGPFRLNLVPTVIFNSRPDKVLGLSRNIAINPDSNHTFSLGIGTDIAVHNKVSLLGEYVPRLAGYGGLRQRNDQLGGGIAIRTWGHVFTILVSSSRDFTPSQYGVNAMQRNVALGFNIYRRIR